MKKGHVFLRLLMGLSGGSVVKSPPTNAGAAGDVGLILGQEDPLEEEMATPSCLEIFVPGDFRAWRTPWTEEPGGLQSTGSQRVGLD